MKSALNLDLLREFVIITHYYVFCVLNESDINGTRCSFVQLGLYKMAGISPELVTFRFL
jgi:hypothetical protein